MTHLAIVDGRYQPVAEALATKRFGLGASFAQEVLEGLARTTVAQAAVRLPIGLPQVAEVADTLASLEDVGVGYGARHAQHLEWESGR